MLEKRSIDQYKDIIGQDTVDEIKDLAKKLEGASVTHINSTKFGGGVAEILKSLVPLANSAGLKVNWVTMKAMEEFFEVTKNFHNALQGMNLPLTEEMKAVYLKYNRENAERLETDSDVIFIHDPQPAPLVRFFRNQRSKFLWRCHIDLTNANVTYWEYIKDFIEKFDGLIFSLNKYVREDVSHKRVYVVPPSIDPLSRKNKSLTSNEILSALKRYDIDPERPIITQVARFDYWKDPLGVVDCYELVKQKIPDVQLLLVGSMADDDPEGEGWYTKAVEKAKDLKDVHILTNHDDVGDLEVNAFQRASNVVIQKSIREGFSLSVTEALWKGTPVVATRAGGIPLQVIDGVTGFLINNVEDAAERIRQLIKNQYLAKMLGMEGKEHIKRNFLITRHLKDYVKIHLEIIEPKLT